MTLKLEEDGLPGFLEPHVREFQRRSISTHCMDGDQLSALFQEHKQFATLSNDEIRRLLVEKAGYATGALDHMKQQVQNYVVEYCTREEARARQLRVSESEAAGEATAREQRAAKKEKEGGSDAPAKEERGTDGNSEQKRDAPEVSGLRSSSISALATTSSKLKAGRKKFNRIVGRLAKLADEHQFECAILSTVSPASVKPTGALYEVIAITPNGNVTPLSSSVTNPLTYRFMEAMMISSSVIPSQTTAIPQRTPTTVSSRQSRTPHLSTVAHPKSAHEWRNATCALLVFNPTAIQRTPEEMAAGQHEYPQDYPARLRAKPFPLKSNDIRGKTKGLRVSTEEVQLLHQWLLQRKLASSVITREVSSSSISSPPSSPSKSQVVPRMPQCDFTLSFLHCIIIMLGSWQSLVALLSDLRNSDALEPHLSTDQMLHNLHRSLSLWLNSQSFDQTLLDHLSREWVLQLSAHSAGGVVQEVVEALQRVHHGVLQIDPKLEIRASRNFDTNYRLFRNRLTWEFNTDGKQLQESVTCQLIPLTSIEQAIGSSPTFGNMRITKTPDLTVLDVMHSSLPLTSQVPAPLAYVALHKLRDVKPALRAKPLRLVSDATDNKGHRLVACIVKVKEAFTILTPSATDASPCWEAHSNSNSTVPISQRQFTSMCSLGPDSPCRLLCVLYERTTHYRSRASSKASSSPSLSLSRPEASPETTTKAGTEQNGSESDKKRKTESDKKGKSRADKKSRSKKSKPDKTDTKSLSTRKHETTVAMMSSSSSSSSSNSHPPTLPAQQNIHFEGSYELFTDEQRALIVQRDPDAMRIRIDQQRRKVSDLRNRLEKTEDEKERTILELKVKEWDKKLLESVSQLAILDEHSSLGGTQAQHGAKRKRESPEAETHDHANKHEAENERQAKKGKSENPDSENRAAASLPVTSPTPAKPREGFKPIANSTQDVELLSYSAYHSMNPPSREAETKRNERMQKNRAAITASPSSLNSNFLESFTDTTLHSARTRILSKHEKRFKQMIDRDLNAALVLFVMQQAAEDEPKFIFPTPDTMSLIQKYFSSEDNGKTELLELLKREVGSYVDAVVRYVGAKFIMPICDSLRNHFFLIVLDIDACIAHIHDGLFDSAKENNVVLLIQALSEVFSDRLSDKHFTIKDSKLTGQLDSVSCGPIVYNCLKHLYVCPNPHLVKFRDQEIVSRSGTTKAREEMADLLDAYVKSLPGSNSSSSLES